MRSGLWRQIPETQWPTRIWATSSAKKATACGSLYYLRQSLEIDPQEPQTVYCLAFAYMELGDMDPAQKHFQKVLAMEAPNELLGLARNRLWEIAFSRSACWARAAAVRSGHQQKLLDQ